MAENLFKILKVRPLNATEDFEAYCKVLEGAKQTQLKRKSIACKEDIEYAFEVLSNKTIHDLYVRIMMASTSRAIFNIHPTDTITKSKLTSARNTLLLLCHPDKQPNASDVIRSECTKLTARVNSEYSKLDNDTQGTSHKRSKSFSEEEDDDSPGGSEAEEDNSHNHEETGEEPKKKRSTNSSKVPKSGEKPKKKKPEKYAKKARSQPSTYSGVVVPQVININLTFQELYMGCKKDIKIVSGVKDVKGQWVNQEVQWTVNIPPRTPLGVFQIVRSKGMYNVLDKYCSDIHFKAVELCMDGVYRVRGFDVETTVNISWVTAIGGGIVDIIFPDGCGDSINYLRYQEGQEITFATRGLRNPLTNIYGALIVKIHFAVPELGLRQQTVFKMFAAQLTSLHLEERERLYKMFERQATESAYMSTFSNNNLF